MPDTGNACACFWRDVFTSWWSHLVFRKMTIPVRYFISLCDQRWLCESPKSMFKPLYPLYSLKHQLTSSNKWREGHLVSIKQDCNNLRLHEDIKGKTLTWVLNPVKKESDIGAISPFFLKGPWPEILGWMSSWGQRLLSCIQYWTCFQQEPVFFWYNVFQILVLGEPPLARSDLYVKSNQKCWKTDF